jgi:hypothetical protein
LDVSNFNTGSVTGSIVSVKESRGQPKMAHFNKLS